VEEEIYISTVPRADRTGAFFTRNIKSHPKVSIEDQFTKNEEIAIHHPEI